MAEARYETTSRTVEETSVVLTLTEEEAKELRRIVGEAESTPAGLSILSALTFATHGEPTAQPVDGFEYAGAMYEYGVVYEDQRGDSFEFDAEKTDDGTPRGRLVYSRGPGAWVWSLAEAVDGYGPLHRIG
ncbi:phiSA1p31-related protein [Streptomyces sp. CBG33]|uniref:phiSA1p31-related protein n=1 Tax=Streptomyces sp. CBG33 TaxID=2762624 RepID=UPI0016458A07|nr:phiSA1p31-related protein [Streptomyces sp. CBG33]